MVGCGQTSATWLPSTMPSPPSTRPSGSRERRSSAFIREDSGIAQRPRRMLSIASTMPYVEAPMNSNAARLTENGTEIVRLFARFSLGAAFLSAVADRFGLWGPNGAKNVSWGNFAHFVEYTGAVTSLFPSSLTVSLAWAATVAETLLGILLIAGLRIRMASVLSGLLLSSFAI